MEIILVWIYGVFCRNAASFNEAFKWIASATRQGHPLHFEFEPGWTLGKYAVFPDRYLLQFIREGGDVITNWKELLTFRIFPPFWGGPSVNEALGKLKEAQEQICPGVTKWNVIAQDQKSILYEWRARPCRALPDRHEIGRIIFAKDKTFILNYIQKTDRMPDEIRDRWVKKFRDAG